MVKELVSHVKEYKKDSLLAPLFVTLEVVMEVVIPLLMAYIIDEGISAGDMGAIVRFGVALVCSAAVSLVFGVLSGKYAAQGSAGFAKNLRRALYSRVQDFSFSNIDKFSASSLVTRLTTDVTNVQNAYQMIIRVAVRGPAMLVFSLIMAFTINARLSLVFLAAIPVLGVGLLLVATRAHPIFEKVFRTYDRLNNIVQENLRGIRVVKSFVREDHEIGKFTRVSGDIFARFTSAEKLLAFNSPLMQLAMYACTLVISWLGAQMIVSATMTTGQLVSLLSYTMQILSSLMMLSMIFVMVTISRASGERIVEVLSEQSDLRDPENPVENVADGSVRFEKVGFSYGGKGGAPCLREIDFSIDSGQTVGILGGTGSAKSTLVQLIPRLYDVTEGAVYVGGVDVRRYDLRALRDQVAMVLQKNELFSGTIAENLRWGNESATDAELERACVQAQAHDFIVGFPDGYDTFIEQGGTNVSGGQKQRLCIARALLKNPKVLILDDSTSAVDTRTDALIRRAFAQSIPDTTKIIIAQRVASVMHADQIIVMDDGAIAAMGDHDALMETSDIYREVYTSQQKGGSTDDDAA